MERTKKFDKNGFIRKAFIFLMIVGPFWFVSVFLVIGDVITTKYDGFALDKNGLLYVGEAKGIAVYDNDKFLRTVYKTNALLWAFTIQDDKLYIAAYGEVEILDLSGDLIETIDDINSSERKMLYRQRYVFVTDEAMYRATNKFGFYQITKYSNSNGKSETIFQMPILDFVLSMALKVIPIIYVIIFFTGYIKWILDKYG